VSESTPDPVYLGRHAERLLSDSAFREAVQAADEKFVTMWREGTDAAERERAHHLQAALQQLVKELGALVGGGEIETRRR